MRPGRASPDPGFGMAVEVVGGNPGHVGDIVVVGQGLPGKGFTPEDPPPPLDQV